MNSITKETYYYYLMNTIVYPGHGKPTRIGDEKPIYLEAKAKYRLARSESYGIEVEPRTLSGFMELLPNEQILFNQMKEKIQKTYEKIWIFTIRYANN